MDRTLRRRSCTAVIAGDQYHLRTGFRNTGRDRADACLRDKLDTDPGILIRIFQVIDQLRQILDRIDIMVGRRRDQPDAWRGMPCLCHPRVNLSGRQMSALAGLCTLCHLDLDLLRAHQISAGDAKTTARHLLDRRAAVDPVWSDHHAVQILTALAGVGLSAKPVHRDRKCLMRFL